ncbi:hypothetical protein N9F67_00485 [bacterium]|nr:hypothetical protein [bacterium]
MGKILNLKGNKMKELNKFRQFINEGKENVDELFGLRGKPDSTKKAAEALEALENALFELNFLDILGDEDYGGWMLKYEELRGRVMAGLDDESREKYDVALMDDEELAENDVALDEVINEGKDTNDEIEEGVIGQTFRKIFGKQEYKEGDIVFLKKNHREVRVILQAKRGDKSKRNRLDYRTQDEKYNLADPEGNIYYIMSEPQPINVKLTIDNAGIDFKKLDSLSKTGYRKGGEKIYQTSIKGEAVWDEGKKRYMPK